MKDTTLLKTGIAGAILAMLGCVTPALFFLLGAVGLSGAVGWLDYVLLPAAFVFAAIIGYAVWRRRARS